MSQKKKAIVVHKSFEELAIVANSFHPKPLRQYLQSRDYFHVLGLTFHDVRLFEGDRIIPIRITNLVTGNTQKKDLGNPRVDDLLDDMGELVMKMGGQVMVLPADKMPSETGLAAIFRY